MKMTQQIFFKMNRKKSLANSSKEFKKKIKKILNKLYLMKRQKRKKKPGNYTKSSKINRNRLN